MHLMVGEKSLLVGDEVAALLTQYAALVARAGSGDVITIRAIDADGDETTATIVLNSGTQLVAETIRSSRPDPDDPEAIAHLRARVGSYQFDPADDPPGTVD